jgi:hypothetical protein
LSQRHLTITFRKYFILSKMTLNVDELFSIGFLTGISSYTKIERLILEVEVYRKPLTVYLLFWFSFYLLGFKLLDWRRVRIALIYVFLDFLKLFHQAIWNVLEVIWPTKSSWTYRLQIRRLFLKCQGCIFDKSGSRNLSIVFANL